MAVCDLTFDVGAQPLTPATHLPLMEMVYSNSILEEKFASAGALNFFQPEVDERWKSDLSIHQSIRLRFKNYQNPFDLVQITNLTYATDAATADRNPGQPATLTTTCDPDCVSTENSWRTVDVRFKNKFRIGVSWCVEEEKLLYQDGEQRFGETVEAAKTVTSTVGWSELICQAIEAPANRLIPTFDLATTHYFDAAAGDPYEVMTKVIQYMQRVFGQRWTSEFAIIADPQFELDILDGTSTLHNYDATGKATAWGHTDTFVAGGFRPMTALPRLWGKPVMIAPDVVDYYPTSGALSGQNLNPFGNAAGTKYYVVVVSKRAFFHGSAPLMDKHYFPATCDNKYDSIQQTWISFYKLLFPNEIFVVAFNRPVAATTTTTTTV